MASQRWRKRREMEKLQWVADLLVARRKEGTIYPLPPEELDVEED
jgi:hypothetical protein